MHTTEQGIHRAIKGTGRKSVTDEAAAAESLFRFSARVFTKGAEGHVPETRMHFLEGKSETLKGFYDHARADSWTI